MGPALSSSNAATAWGATALCSMPLRSRTDGPQEISSHGEAAAVVISAEDFRRLKDPRASRDFKDWLLNGPSLEGVDLERDRRPAREIDPF